jgi:tyrosine-protein phosphatase YwqE
MRLSFPYLSRNDHAANAKSAPGELSFDFHNHLLPGVDDGMQSLADSKRTIVDLKTLGFAGAVITPHLYKDVFDNVASSLRDSFASFVADLGEEADDFPLYLAGEYFADEHFVRLIEQEDLLYLPVAGERWVLLEFPYLQESPFASVCLSALVARGYRPVVAHVERYRYVAQAPDEWLGLFERSGAILQGDIGSLAGQHGEAVKRFANLLVERNIVKIWGTDIHNPGQIKRHIVPGLAHLASVDRLNDILDPLLVGVKA